MKWVMIGSLVFVLAIFATRQAIEESAVRRNQKSTSLLRDKSLSEPGNSLPPNAKVKSRIRPSVNRLTRDETIELLKGIKVAKIDIEDASLKEVFGELNQILDAAGISSETLRLGYGITGKFSDRLLEKRIVGLKVREAPFLVILKYVADQGGTRFRVGGNVVEFQDVSERLTPEDPMVDPYDFLRSLE